MSAPCSSYNDLELFARIALGDEAAFTEFYLRYIKKLLPHMTRLLDSESWAEEMLQDVFTKLWEKRDTLNRVDNPAAFVYRMASNRTLDHLKHKAVEVKMQYWLARNVERLTTEQNPIEQKFDFRTSENLLKEAVGELSTQKQRIFRLRHEDGYTYEEIATELNISKNTVRNHIAEAHQFIRGYLLRKGVVYTVWLAFLLGTHP